jgi:uncharacterized protein YpuA (DUF1002 family)
MTWNLIAGAAALAMLSTAALAQSGSPQNTVETPAVTTGPAGSFSETKKEHSVDSNGVEVNKSQSFDKTQSFSSGAGTLNATTSTRSSAEVTTTVPPPPVTTTTQTTTTIQK